MTPELWQRLKPLYQAALDLPSQSRLQFVIEACGEDRELREELESLLNVNVSTETNETFPIVHLGELLPRGPSTLQIGELLLDRFRIVRHVGSGGMGDVYEAMDIELGRVALKTIRFDIAQNAHLLARFKREVQVARKVNGAHVCRIHELFAAPAGTARPHPPFVTMEYLEGVTLAHSISNSGPTPWQEARAIALDLCAGLRAVHEAGVVHRDLKSGNIMLAERGGRKCSVLMDFGLASEVARPRDTSTDRTTRAGTVVGTPDYMAPEQFEGGPISPATDVYALGVVLYEMLTGKQPFPATTPIAAAIQRAKPVTPVSTLQAGVPREWNRIIAKCLQLRPEDRYQSAAEIEKDLQQRLPSDPGQLRRSWVIRANRAPGSARVAMIVLVGTILAATAALLVWRFYPRPQAFLTFSTGQVTSSGDVRAISLSPDGKTIAQVRSSGKDQALWVRNLTLGKDIQILPATPLSYGTITFSRDGNEIYFVRKEEGSDSDNLYRVPVFGGDPGLVRRNVEKVVAISPDESQIAWIKSANNTDAVHVVTLGNSDDKIVSKFEDRDLYAPAWSPDGRFLAFANNRPRWNIPHATKRVAITIREMASGKQNDIPVPVQVQSVSALTWLPSGKDFLLLFQKHYLGVRDPGDQFGTLSLSGEFRQITNDMTPHNGISLSTDGKSIATLVQQGNSEVSILDSAGTTISSTARFPRDLRTLTWVGDDRLFAFDPWIVALRPDTGEVTNMELKFPASVHTHGYFSSSDVNSTPTPCSSDRILITGDLDQVAQLYLVDAHGQFVKTVLKTWAESLFCSQSSDLVYFVNRSVNDASIWRLRLNDNFAQKLMSLPHFAPIAYSSDGKQAAYVSESNGGTTATIIDLDRHTVIRELPLPGYVHDSLPHFTPDRHSLAFVQQNEQGFFALALVPLDGSPMRLLPTVFGKTISDFGWSPSGKRLAVLWDHSTSDGAVITDSARKSAE